MDQLPKIVDPITALKKENALLKSDLSALTDRVADLEVRTPIEDFFTQNDTPILINDPTEVITATNQKSLLGPFCVQAGHTIDFSALVVQDRI